MFKKNFCQLFGRINIKFTPGQHIYLIGNDLQTLLILYGSSFEKLDIKIDPVHLDPHQDLNQGPLYLFKKIIKIVIFQFRRQQLGEKKSKLSIFTGIIRDFFRHNLIDSHLLTTRAHHLFESNWGMAKMLQSQSVESMPMPGRVNQIRCHHRVEGDTLKLTPGPFQDNGIVLDILAPFFDLAIA